MQYTVAVALILFLVWVVTRLIGVGGRLARRALVGCALLVVAGFSIDAMARPYVPTEYRPAIQFAVIALTLFGVFLPGVKAARTVLLGVAVVVLAVPLLWGPLSGWLWQRVAGNPTQQVSPYSDAVDLCPDVALVGARGSGEPRLAGGGFGDVVGPVFALVKADVEASGGTVGYYPVDYAALAVIDPYGDPAAVGSMETYMEGAVAGANVAAATINAIASCTSTDIVVAGYSQGAMVMRKLANDPIGQGHTIVSEHLIADPLRAAGQVDPRGGIAPGEGVWADLAPAELAPGASSWCDPGDPVCAWGDGDNTVAVHTENYKDPDFTRLVADRILQDLGLD